MSEFARRTFIIEIMIMIKTYCLIYMDVPILKMDDCHNVHTRMNKRYINVHQKSGQNKVVWETPIHGDNGIFGCVEDGRVEDTDSMEQAAVVYQYIDIENEVPMNKEQFHTLSTICSHQMVMYSHQMVLLPFLTHFF